MLDIFNSLDVARGISPAAAVADNTPYVSQIVDLRGTQGAIFIIEAGVEADADVTFTVLAETGDDAALADAVATPDEQLLGTEALASFTFAADNKVFKIGLRGGYHGYGRITITPANNSGNAFV